MADLLYVYALLDRRVAPPTPGVRPASKRGRSGVRAGSEWGQSSVGVGSEQGQSRVRAASDPRIRRIEVIDVGGVFAAVERLAEAPALTEQVLREQHQMVVRLARMANAILPVRFGTLVDREELERVVAARRDLFDQALRDVYGKAQMTVRVFGPPMRSAALRRALSGTDYLRSRAALAKPRLPKIAKAIVDAVRPLVAAETIDAGRADVRVTINHLIDRRAVRQYAAAVEAAPGRPEVGGQRPEVLVSGPWPPFAFVPDFLSDAMPLERLTP